MLWRCSVCGFVHEGDRAPDFCPKCGAPAEKFIQLGEEEAKKIITADRTNDIHMKIVDLAVKIQALAEEGIQINLDPPCLSLFQQARQEAVIIKQRSKAEIAGHVGRGKW